MPSTIDTDADVVTLINVFTEDPARRDELIACLVEATEDTIRRRPGFVSANIHAALDGTRVANYAQWASVADFQAMVADPACQPHLAAASALASADPQLYTVVSVHSTCPAGSGRGGIHRPRPEVAAEVRDGERDLTTLS